MRVLSKLTSRNVKIPSPPPGRARVVSQPLLSLSSAPRPLLRVKGVAGLCGAERSPHRAMPKPHYAKRKSLPAAPPPAQGDDMKDDEDMPDVLQRAQPDDIIKPEVVFNTAQLPFGVLCSIYDELEKATRMKQKNKAETKGQMLEHFFKVRICSCTVPNAPLTCPLLSRTALEGAHRQRPVPCRPPDAARS